MVKKNQQSLYRGERCVVTDLLADNLYVWVVDVRNASGIRVDLRKIMAPFDYMSKRRGQTACTVTTS